MDKVLRPLKKVHQTYHAGGSGRYLISLLSFAKAMRSWGSWRFSCLSHTLSRGGDEGDSSS